MCTDIGAQTQPNSPKALQFFPNPSTKMSVSQETIFRVVAVAILLLVFIGALISQFMCTSIGPPIEFRTTDPYTRGKVLG